MITYEYFVSVSIATNKGVFFLDMPYICGKEIIDYNDIELMKECLLKQINDKKEKVNDKKEKKFDIQLLTILNFKLLNSRIINKSTGSDD